MKNKNEVSCNGLLHSKGWLAVLCSLLMLLARLGPPQLFEITPPIIAAPCKIKRWDSQIQKKGFANLSFA
jgi:hypothetical protein